MRTITKTIELYKYHELSDKAKDRAYTDHLRRIIGDDWWFVVYDDAKEIGLKIGEFDLDRGTISGKLEIPVREAVRRILKNHGPSCDTYQAALQFYRDRHERNRKHSDAASTTFVAVLLTCYRYMLQKEYDYLQSVNHFEEECDANGYEFTSDGKLWIERDR